jgi:hypothetical protein
MNKLIATALSTAILVAAPFAFAGTPATHMSARGAHANAAVHARSGAMRTNARLGAARSGSAARTQVRTPAHR